MTAAFSWVNHVTGSTLSVSGGTVDAGYPLANMADPDPSLVTRINYSAAGGAVKIYAISTFSVDKTVRVVAALNMRVPQTATLNNMIFEVLNSGGSLLAASAIIKSQLVPIPGTTDRFNAFGVFSADQTTVRSVRLGIQENSPVAADYFEGGYLWAGPALVLSNEFSQGWELQTIDPSEVARARGGMYAAQRLPTRRALSGSLANAAYATAMGTSGSPATPSVRALALEAGISTPVVVIPSISDVHARQTESIYGLLTEVPSLSAKAGNYFDSRFRVEEIR